jgi:hypothetical protein
VAEEENIPTADEEGLEDEMRNSLFEADTG